MSVDELEKYFSGIILPKSLALTSYSFIPDVRVYIESCLTHIRKYGIDNHHNNRFNNLLELKEAIEKLDPNDKGSTGELYVIRTHPTLTESLHITFHQYEILRNTIIDHILKIYDRVDYSDAGINSAYLLCYCIGEYQSQMNTFYVPSWLDYLEKDTFDIKMCKRLDWCKENIAKVKSNWKIKRVDQIHPITSTSVIR